MPLSQYRRKPGKWSRALQSVQWIRRATTSGIRTREDFGDSEPPQARIAPPVRLSHLQSPIGGNQQQDQNSPKASLWIWDRDVFVLKICTLLPTNYAHV